MISRRQALAPGQGPDLQKVHLVALVLVLLRMRDAGAASRELHVAPVHAVEIVLVRRVGAVFFRDHGISVRKFAREDVREDLGVAVWVCWEAVKGRDAVFVEDAEGAEG